jgi:DNA repair protein RadC
MVQAARASELSDEELIALVIPDTRTDVNCRDQALHRARGLLEAFGGLRGLMRAGEQALACQPALGPAGAAQVAAVQELARRWLRAPLQRGKPLESPDATHRYLQSVLHDQQYEVFMGLFLDTRHRVIACEELFHGTIDGATVYPRVVAEKALSLGAAALIVAHNHPSGVSEPSLADQAITRRLKDALALLDIRLLDHFVIGDGRPVSMASRGML